MFKNIQVKSLDYERQNYIGRYPTYHPHFTDDKEYVMSDDFLGEYKDFDYDNEESARLHPVYRNLVVTEFQKSFSKIDSTFSDFDKILSSIEKKKSARVRDELLNYALFYFNANNDNVVQIRDNLLNLASCEGVKNKINKKYEKIKNLIPGNTSPTFIYENYKGGETALSDLNGKYVYIDVWATWCGPCIAEIPSLKLVENDFENKNKAFVSISIDESSDYQKWRDLIVKKELGGTQLMSDNNWESQFVKDYTIDGIPRFILLDPTGNIISADAKRPSNPELAKQLEELTSRVE